MLQTQHSILIDVIGITLVLFASSCENPEKEKQALIQVESDMANAYVQGDIKTLERIFADDFTITSDDWKIVNKADSLKRIKPLKGFTVELSHIEVNLNPRGNAAIVNGVAAFMNGDQEHAYRFGDGFVKRQGRWQLVSSDHRELKPLTVQACSPEPSSTSSSPGSSTYTRFTNLSSQPILVYSRDTQGKHDEASESKRITLRPGQSAHLHTSVTRPFVVTDVGGECIGIYQPTEMPSLVVIK